MGYFANGTEGMDYQERYCTKCVHDQDHDCPIWLMHLLHINPDDSAPEQQILDALIPTEGTDNLQCRFFLPLPVAETLTMDL